MSNIVSNRMFLMGLLGVLVGILTAPRKGTETQEILRQKAKKIQDDMSEKANKAKSKIKSKQDQTEDFIQQDSTPSIDQSIRRLFP